MPGPVEKIRWLPFRCSVNVPAFGVMVPDGSTTDGGQVILKTKKATSGDLPTKIVYVNGPADYTAGGTATGACAILADMPFYCLCDAGSPPSAGDRLQPVAGQWSVGVSEDGSLLAVNDGGADGKVLVVRHTGGTASDDCVPFKAADDETVPEYGVICAYDTTCNDLLPVYTDAGNASELGFVGGSLKYSPGENGYTVRWMREYFVNIGGEVASGDSGRCSPCTTKIHLAAYESATGTPAAGEIWGPAPGTYKLHRGLPGFIIYGPVDTSAHTVGVMRDVLNTPVWCRAIENWKHEGVYGSEPTVLVNPMTPANALSTNSFCYDGTHKSPRIEFVVALPSGWKPNSINLAVLHAPNVIAGNCFSARFADGRMGDVGWALVPATSWYLDDPIGTVRMVTTTTVPQGWALMNGTANASGNGGSGINMDSRFPYGSTSAGTTGGGTTHTHTIPAGSGIAAGTDLGLTTSANGNLPPYCTLRFIERLDNGIT